MKKLKELRKNNNKKQEELANYLKINKMTYCNYENDNREPNIETIIKLADYFKVSIDYLLDHPTNNINLDELTLLQKDLIKKIINCNELICTKVDAYITGLIEGQKEQQAIIEKFKRNN